ncbi:caspase family protein [Myxococcus sp. K15C18031901]|uniref:caspase family protein n=1 Tax=Myxococcus dinghuensis TaxID=2906761 RepID=UPI0020A7CC20|nr:caspase family protein [Myxococcus dinghuensis]MCP3102731.1 caspase family protein [Myxococcus dinghuensis]
MSARGARVLGALLVLLSVSVASAESRFSISVGHDLGLDSDEPLRWAQQDAERMDAVFGQLGGVPEDRRLLLRGESVSNLRLGLARMRGRMEEARRAGERTLLFFYFSGHGDEASLRVGGEALPLAELQRLLAEVQATVTVAMLDACHSGALVRGRSKGFKSAPAFDISFLRQVGPAGRVFIASAGAHEVAQESDSLRGSFFTHHLISGLRGAADVDGDGRVSLTEAYAYVYHRTLAGSHASTAAVQHPELSSQLAGEGDLFLTTLSRSHARLELPAGVGDSVVLVDERTLQVMAEVAPRAEDPVSVALPSGRYRVQVRRGPQVLYGKVYLPWGETQRLKPESLEVRTLALHQRKGALLEASTWRLQAALGAARSSTQLGGWGPQVGVLLAREGTGGLGLSFLGGLTLGASRGSTPAQKLQQVELGLWSGLGLAGSVGRVWVGGHAGVGVLGLAQRATSPDAERRRELGLPAGRTRTGAGVAIFATLTAEVPVSASTGLFARLGGHVALMREDEKLRTQSAPLLMLGCTWGL